MHQVLTRWIECHDIQLAFVTAFAASSDALVSLHDVTTILEPLGHKFFKEVGLHLRFLGPL
jgi:hypothetical protein